MNNTQTLTHGSRYDDAHDYGVKVAYFDIDNTLVENMSSGLPTERFKAAADAAKGKIAVAIATARPLAKAGHIIDYIGADGLSILCNGAQIYDGKTKTFIAEWPMKVETTLQILDSVRRLGVEYWINDDGIDHFPTTLSGDNPQYERQQDIWQTDSPRAVVPDYIPSKPFVVVLHDVSDETAKAVDAIVNEHDDPDVTSFIAHQTKRKGSADESDGNSEFVYDMFIVNKFANKQHALHEALRLQGLDSEQAMAVGDGRNDAVLVGSAGVGVAMGNSATETLAVATHITANQWEDGAALALEYAHQHFTV